MKFLIAISTHPESQTALVALNFATSVLTRHQIPLVFLFAEGVLNSHRSSPLAAQWKSLISEYSLDAVCCSNSAAEFGVLDSRQRLPQFAVGGLAQLTTTAAITADRVITFGTRRCLD